MNTHSNLNQEHGVELVSRGVSVSVWFQDAKKKNHQSL